MTKKVAKYAASKKAPAKKPNSQKPPNGTGLPLNAVALAAKTHLLGREDGSRSGIQSIHDALFIFAAVFPGVEKKRQNTFTNSLYANLDDVMNAAQPYLTALGLMFIYTTSDSDNNGAPRNTLACVLRHLPTGMELASYLPLPDVEAGAQVLGSTMTYWRRYLAAGLLNIREEADDDGNMAAMLGPTAPAKLSEKQYSEILDYVEATGTQMGDIETSGTLLHHVYTAMNCESIDQLSTQQASIILKMLKTKHKRMEGGNG
jgi:hypothetical protein